MPIFVRLDPQEAIPQRKIRRMVEVLEIIQSRGPLGRSMTSGTSPST